MQALDTVVFDTHHIVLTNIVKPSVFLLTLDILSSSLKYASLLLILSAVFTSLVWNRGEYMKLNSLLNFSFYCTIRGHKVGTDANADAHAHWERKPKKSICLSHMKLLEDIINVSSNIRVEKCYYEWSSANNHIRKCYHITILMPIFCIWLCLPVHPVNSHMPHVER